MTAPIVTRYLREPISTFDLPLYAQAMANADGVADALRDNRPKGQLWERLAER